MIENVRPYDRYDDKMDEVIEAVNTLTERLAETEKIAFHASVELDRLAQVEPDEPIGATIVDKGWTGTPIRDDESPSEPDTEPEDSLKVSVTTNLTTNESFVEISSRFTRAEAEAAADKIRNLLKGQV